MIEINIGYPLTEKQLKWLEKNVGERYYYLHTQTAGHGWKFFRKKTHKEEFTLIFEDESMASYFVLSCL